MEPPPSDESHETYHRGRDRVALGAGVAAATAAFVVGLAAWRRRPFRVEIEGASMIPMLIPGDWALAVATRRVRRGDVVVVEHPGRPGYEMVKRIVALPGGSVSDGRVLAPDEYWIEGDHAGSSTDSRQFGPVTRQEIKARVLAVYWPPERRRRL